MANVPSPRVLPGRRACCRLGRWLARLTLRTRLVAAFIALIVTSAAATIVIGNLVFGQKVVDLAISNMQAGLKVAQLALSVRFERLRLLARAAALHDDLPASVHEDCLALFADEEVLDFVLLATPADTLVLRLSRGADGPGGTRTCTRSVLGRALPADSALAGFAAAAGREARARGGLLALSSAEMVEIGYPEPDPEGLFVAAAAPLADGTAIVLGALLNGRTDLVAEPVDLVWPQHGRQYAATLFLRDRRVATTIGNGGVGTRADAEVVRRVLDEGGLYVGSAKVIDDLFYTAYMPLRDYRGVPIGILGIGAREEVYVDMRNRTIALFSTLIGLGMIFGFVMTYLFSAWLVRPIGELARGMDRVARGDLEFKVRIGSADELGRLAHAFNLMVKNIKERDIRLHEMTDERLSQVEKQVSIGRLAAGVAHEINNPLTSVLSLSMLLRKGLSGDDPRREDLDIIVEETTRCREIVRNLLDFARERPTAEALIDLNQVIRETLVLTRKYEGMDRVRTVLELHDAPQLVNADAKQLQQVLTNLITNAAEATSATGGTITISTDEDSSGAFVVARVTDTGRGMPPANLKRAFEPFFTTKGTGKGTGLGLSVSLGIVRKHNGTIEIASLEGRGTTVTVTLPRATEADGGAADGAESAFVEA